MFVAEREDRQRLDLWLWHARVVRSRSAATALVRSGHVRVDGARIVSAGHAVRVGQVVTVSLDAGVRVLRIRDFSPRRGNATAAAEIFEDLTSEQSEK
ncbi:RNA-binding S4 domain-containing protein [Aquabacter sp. L1I39]|uniref:RNA-binding S4 domain-containing protein n=1 Tax=Aquabacter TaxID=45402 RepID=UPI001ADC4841|nr:MULTISPECIES: S4 domain-containing protein [unclassified Aquabacter]MDE1570478.1 S4 domain-containing protein [Aquabacter sp. P-9]QTL05854.1 RNA-binding S4 domain-containing protein [Aquabacter sp. L1I39]